MGSYRRQQLKLEGRLMVEFVKVQLKVSIMAGCSVAGEVSEGLVHFVGDRLVLAALLDEVVCGVNVSYTKLDS